MLLNFASLTSISIILCIKWDISLHLTQTEPPEALISAQEVVNCYS